jgi:subtilisin family serine protease
MIRNKYFLFIIFFAICFSANAQIKYFKMPAHVADSDYIPQTIIFKIKPELSSFCKGNEIDMPKLNNAFTAIGANKIFKKFPSKTSPKEKINRYGEKLVDLSLIYELKYSGNISLESAINELLSSGLLEYAEPHYLPHLYTAFNPNDAYADTTSAQFCQWHLKTIKAYDAWGIQKGDTNIVIGIVDTGIDTLHPDLKGNIKINYADPVNGIDDDNDGFIDNYYGYDLGENKGSPQWDAEGHGVFVAGLSSAVANNSVGDAGVGFKCKYLPVKITDATGVLTMAYEGIVYAVDHGCQIVNCSWGGYGGEGQYGQSIINYAVNNMNALVVAACGNNNNNYPMYPASYDNVLSVAATSINDYKWSGSSYGTLVGISAPGDGVYSTWINSGYLHSSGTSFASPIVCGAAAIVKAQNPTFSAAQIAAQLKASTDNIDTIPNNIPYAGMLGTGRLNMYKALTNASPWISMVSNTIFDHNNMAFVSGDTLNISGIFKNFLSPSNSDLNVSISTTCPYATIIKSNVILGVINTLASKNSTNAFSVKLLPGIPASTQIDFKLTYNDMLANYTSTQFFSVIVNVDYLNIDTNKVATTMTSTGKIGYNMQSSYTQGVGFVYNGSAPFLHCGGFLVGNSTAQVSDEIYGDVSGSYDNNFKTKTIVHKILPPVVSDFDAETIFNDSLASNSMGLVITNKAYAWNPAPKDKFIIMEYTIKNYGTATLPTLYAGMFMDFDMGTDGTKDRISYDATNKMSYTYSTEGGTYAAIQLLSNGLVHHYAFDKNGQGFNGYAQSMNIDNGFNSYDKYSALSVSNSDHNTAGIPNGNDVADMLSSGPFILQPGDSVTLAFALIAGDHLADIQSSAIAADQIYNHTGIAENSMNNAIQLSDIFPNPSNNSFSVNIHLPAASDIDLSLFDLSGKKLQSIKSGKLLQGDHQFTVSAKNFAAGIYYVRLTCGNMVISKDVTIVK